MAFLKFQGIPYFVSCLIVNLYLHYPPQPKREKGEEILEQYSQFEKKCELDIITLRSSRLLYYQLASLICFDF